MITSSKYIIYCLAFLILSVSLKAQTPNIVIIVCDDLNDSIEGIGGHPQAYTPNINRIAASGVTFTNAASNAPICGPSRASLWSGIHPITSGMYGGNQQNNRWYNNAYLKDKKTLFDALINDGGYYNFATGKIHHNGHESPYNGNANNTGGVSGVIHNNIMRNTDGSAGFDTKGNFGPYPNTNTAVFQGVDPPWWPQAYKDTVSPPYSGFGYYQDLGNNHKWTNQSGGANSASFTTWNYDDNGTPNDFSDDTRDSLSDEISAEKAVNFINNYNKAKPFLLTVGFVRPHSPYYAPVEYFQAPYVPSIDDVQLAPINSGDYLDITGPVNSTDKDLAQTSGWWKYTQYTNMGIDAYNDADRAMKEFTQAYLACVAFVDAQVGKILDAIEESSDANIRENTIVIFTSDHGYHLGEKLYIFKQSPWEESCRVPFVVSGPGVVSNQVCDTPISLVDIYPTCVDFADMEAPHALDGSSIRPLLANPTSDNWDGSEYSVSGIGSSASVTLNAIAPYSEQHFSIRTAQYRYIYYRNGQEELYDHNTDPNEWENLASLPEHLSALETMRIYYRYAVGLEEPPPPGPTFYFVKPIEGEGFYLNEPILLEAGGTNVDLSSVEFYIEGTSIKNDGAAPYTATLYEVSQGDIVLSAIGKQSSGDDLNAQVNISVGNSGFEASLIDNLGFESGNADSGLIPFGSINLSISSAQAYAGNNSLFVERSATSSPATWNGVRFYLSGSNATDSLEVGATYQFSSKVYLDASSANLALTIKELSDPIAYNTVDSFDQGVEAGAWVNLSGQFVYQDIMDFIYIAGVDAGVDFYVDDISLSKAIPSVNPEDTDSDGMLDSWEQSNFSSLDTLPNEDSDNDGLSNVLEYRSGTDPNNQYSLFRHYDFTYLGETNQIQWLGSPEKEYRVLGTTDLSLNQWQVLAEMIQGDNTTLNNWAEDHLDSVSKFYKIEIDN
jgi:arylsulfatase A-like enzyme